VDIHYILRSAATGVLLVPRTQTATGQRRTEHLQAGTEDTSLLIRPATLSRFRDFAAAYKSADLLTYLYTFVQCVPKNETFVILNILYSCKSVVMNLARDIR